MSTCKLKAKIKGLEDLLLSTQDRIYACKTAGAELQKKADEIYESEFMRARMDSDSAYVLNYAYEARYGMSKLAAQMQGIGGENE